MTKRQKKASSINPTSKDVALKQRNHENDKIQLDALLKSVSQGDTEASKALFNQYRLEKLREIQEQFGDYADQTDSAVVAQLNHVVETGDFSVFDKPVVRIQTKTGSIFLL